MEDNLMKAEDKGDEAGAMEVMVAAMRMRTSLDFVMEQAFGIVGATYGHGCRGANKSRH